MIQITPQMRILVAVEPVDFRRGIDGLAQVCRETLAADPFSGTVFVFRGRSGTSVKLLAFDGQGYWLCQKRLSKGRFRWWPGKPGSARRGSWPTNFRCSSAGAIHTGQRCQRPGVQWGFRRSRVPT